LRHKVCATSPHHVTALFKPYIAKGGLGETGSTGVGLVVEPRARICVPGERGLGDVAIATVRRVGELLGLNDLKLEVNTPLPPGVGFAVSASTAIASALTMGFLRNLSYTKSLKVAHEAEVIERTGLGDVLAISCGVGLAVRIKPGAPGLGFADCRQIPPGLSILALAVKQEHTRDMVRYYVEMGLHEKAAPLIERIAESMDFNVFSELVLKFNVDNGLLRRLVGESGEEHLLKTPGLLTVYGKKGVVVVVVESDKLGDSLNHLQMLGYKIYYLEPSRGGPELWVV
jgi:Predicted archaeal kinase (sugar kinase superfamily)